MEVTGSQIEYSLPDSATESIISNCTLETVAEFKDTAPISDPGEISERDEEGITNVGVDYVSLAIESKSDLGSETANRKSSAKDLHKKPKSPRKYSFHVGCLVISIISSIYFTDCQMIPVLPIYLIVDACVTLVFFTVPYFYTRGHKERPKNGQWKFPAIVKVGCGLTLILFLFHTAWLIYGTVLVVDTRNTMYSCTNATNMQPLPGCLKCNETLANFTLIIVVVQWVIVGLILLIVTFLSCCFLCSICFNK
ncbi:uncharacterized protein LOC106080317 isoform X2 [Biomphalaria glabrata]|uniref:Uncharacterized protein LOC106080317 isoform X2 n=1 Tax=Biomphalaria glabrata TaxID=6526 RepID=A0A9W3BDF5_BIOGL|nr:uncharacterized protein LOC106080317 isoform X2 [Biomphalaria glabrata]